MSKDNELRLRPYKSCDGDIIAGWIKDEKALRQWSSDRFGNFPVTGADINYKYLENNGDCRDDYNFYPVTALSDEGIIGHMILRFTDDTLETLRFGFVIVDDSKRGRGYGKKMLELALKYAFEILKANRVSLGVFDNNPNAFYCYKSTGFTETGMTIPVHIMNEEWTVTEMEIKKDDYESNNRN